MNPIFWLKNNLLKAYKCRVCFYPAKAFEVWSSLKLLLRVSI